MTQKEKFIAILNERIKTSSSTATETAYIIIKDAFEKLYPDISETIMTIEELNKLEIGMIRTGTISNSPTGVFMTDDPELTHLTFVVNKRVEGWTVYIGRTSQTFEDILKHGDKSNTEEYIRRMFPCTDEVWKLYCR